MHYRDSADNIISRYKFSWLAKRFVSHERNVYNVCVDHVIFELEDSSLWCPSEIIGISYYEEGNCALINSKIRQQVYIKKRVGEIRVYTHLFLGFLCM